MSQIRIILYEKEGANVNLLGSSASEADPVQINSLQIQSPTVSINESFDFIGGNTVQIPRIFLAAIAGQADTFHFVVPDLAESNLEFSTNLVFSDEANAEFLGQKFSLNAGFWASFTLRLPTALQAQDSTDPIPQPSAAIEFYGNVEFSISGESIQASIPLYLQVGFDDLFSTLPTSRLPTLDIGLPDFGFDFPRLSIPWNFPELPSFPFNFPAQQFSIKGFPIRISWKSVQISAVDGLIAIDLIGLAIGGEQQSVEGDLHLVWKNSALNVDKSYFDLYKPNFRNLLRLQFSQWFFDENCLLMTWQKGQINYWLSLIVPDWAEAIDDDTDITLRILRENGELSEVRFDWTPAAERTFPLPGVEVTLPPDTRFSFIYYRGNDTGKLALIVTEESNQPIIAESSFAFNRFFIGPDDKQINDPERELLNDDKQDSRIKLTATPTNHPISVALIVISFPLNGNDAPLFFRQLETPIQPLDVNDLEAPTLDPPLDPDDPNVTFSGPLVFCLPTDIQLKSIQKADWTLDLEVPKIDLPFLKVLEEKAEAIQSIRVASAKLIGIDGQPIEFTYELVVTVLIAPTLQLNTTVSIKFNLEKFAFEINDEHGIDFVLDPPTAEEFHFLGLVWKFNPDTISKPLFTLVTKNKNYQLRQAEGSRITVDFPQVGSSGETLQFELRDFALTPNGVNARGRVVPTAIKLGGLNTSFRFTEGEFAIEDSTIRDFSIAGSGALPPKLVGDATANIALQFSTGTTNTLELVSSIAQLRGKNLLDCKATRFQFSVDGLGLRFVNDGRYHFYFTITGQAKFVPLSGDPSDGPLSWLPGIELQLVDCPLTDDISVLSKHVRFLVEMPKKPTFNFLGCFKMELRAIGFIPQAPEFGGEAAMELSGQLMFAQGTDDVVDARIDFHNLLIGLPEPGHFFPRIHFKDLAVRIRSGDAFSLEGTVSFLDEEAIESGLLAKGFSGGGTLSIQNFLTATATFTFLNVSRDGGKTYVRAWFIYVQLEQVSIRIPILNIFIREIGLGFGYRYTLASIRRADELDDPRALIKELQRLSLTQGELSRRDQWRVDIEEPGQDPRWTIAARMMIAQNSAAKGFFDYDPNAEAVISSIFLLDVVLGIRSDLTILMTARAWLNTNYHDYRTKESLRTRPLLSGFVLLSVPKRRFLAHFASNPGAEFGDHPPLPDFLKKALRDSYFSGTLLIEPGLFHYELGWPNQLRWLAKLGPINAEFTGGTIFRVSRTDVVYGTSFMARGTLELSAKAGGDSVGARISALATIAYGARYIGVIGLDRPLERSALYGAVGIDINVRFQIEFWLKIKLGFVKLKIQLNFEFTVQITALVEIGFTPQKLIGASGTATVILSIMGRSLHFKIHVGVNQEAVDLARAITSQYLNIGLEATEAEPIPGTSPQAVASQPLTVAAPAPAPAVALAHALTQPGSQANVDEEPTFVAPNYSIFCIPAGNEACYFLLYPNENKLQGEDKQGFLPVPPDTDDQASTITSDFKWALPALGSQISVEQFDSSSSTMKTITPDADNVYGWKVAWEQDQQNKPSATIKLRELLQKTFISNSESPDSPPLPIDQIKPSSDPIAPILATGSTEDARVYNPSEAAFEAAVRGAAEQFEGSPYFKRDPNSPYETNLANAFADTTSIYADNGQKAPDKNAQGQTIVTEDEKTEQALQLRSLIVNQMLTDFQKFVDSPAAVDVTESVAFRAGLVFKVKPTQQANNKDWLPDWLRKPIGAGNIQQRSKVSSLSPDSVERDVKIFNIEGTSFQESTPDFQRVRQYTDVNSVAITWDLVWSETIQARDNFAQLFPDPADAEQFLKPDHFLKYYLIRRRALDGSEHEVEFNVKPVQVPNRPSVKGTMIVSFPDQTIHYEPGGLHIFDPGQTVRIAIGTSVNSFAISAKAVDVQPTQIKINPLTDTIPFAAATFGLVGDVLFAEVIIYVSKIQLLRPRFQFTDNFNHEPAKDQAALAREGKSYLYTITPVDVTGAHSPRPLTIVATRRSNLPPPVPAESEFQVTYTLTNDSFKAQGLGAPLIAQPDKDKIILQWVKPANTTNQPFVSVKYYRLIFRREKTLPIGFYGLDSASEGNRNEGLPSSNARTLRTDSIISIPKEQVQEHFDTTTKEKRLFLTIAPERLETVFPQDGKWRPDAWHIFLQTEGENGVLSSLVPVKIVLQFTTAQLSNSLPINSKQPLLERQPALLEWPAQPTKRTMLAPEDEKANVGFANIIMPKFMPNLSFADPLTTNVAELIEFRPAPNSLRAVQLRWNQSPSGDQHFPANLQAGYQLYEFDFDAHSADVLDNPRQDFLDRMRRIQEMRLLTPTALTITPDTAAVANQWEAWYPSTVRRLDTQNENRKKRQDNQTELPLTFSEADLSPWFSWRDSYLQWVKDERMISGSVSLDISNQTLTLSSGNLNRELFKPGAFVRVIGFSNPQNNGVKQTSSNETSDINTLQFVSGSFTLPETAQQVTLDVLSASPFHPLLSRLLKELDNDTISVDINPLPNIKFDTLDVLQQQTSAQQDPYGWTLLKLLGLSVAFSLRDRATGLVLEPLKTQDAIKQKLNNLSDELKQHLFIEFLFQPAKSLRLETESSELNGNELLSLVQISLRPIAKQYYQYFLYRIQKKAEDDQRDKKYTLTINFPNGGSEDATLIDLSRNALVIPVQKEAETKLEITFSTSNEIVLLLRSSKEPDKAQCAELDQNGFKPIRSDPSSWATLNFDVPIDAWLSKFQNDLDVAPAWQQFSSYVSRLNPDPNTSTDVKIVFPQPTEAAAIAGLLTWLNSLFLASGDKIQAADGLWHTGGGASFATAYPRALSPTSLTPDTAKRLTYYHRIEDRWAHGYRYYFLPELRYDRLWEALANSDELFPQSKPALDWFTPPGSESGGLDVIIDRIKPVAAPLILFSGRLDEKTSVSQPTTPGKIWEVIIAKHPEQLLIERNRTLVRQLDYRQIAFTQQRRFAFFEALAALKEELAKQTIALEPILTPATETLTLPGPVEKPDHFDLTKLFDLTNLNASDSIDRLSLDLPSRLGVFGQDAIVLQWRSLPFFYEHALFVVAQTSTQVSPVTTVIQHEFEYQSPQPEAQYVATESANGDRVLQVDISLKNYWESLPQDVKDRWPSEDPAHGSDMLFAALPDTGVVYQISLTDKAQNVETQAEFYYDLTKPLAVDDTPKTNYKVRQLGKKFIGEPIQIMPNGIGFKLRVELRYEEAATVPKPGTLPDADRPATEDKFRNWISTQAISSRRDIEKAVASIDRLEFVAPTATILGLDVAVEDRPTVIGELQTLLQNSSDDSFTNALQQLIDLLDFADDNQSFFTAEACIGLEQLREIATTVDVGEVNPHQISWKGPLNLIQDATLAQWQKTSSFGGQFAVIRTTLQEFTNSVALPDQTLSLAIPPVLLNHLRVDTSTEGIKTFGWVNGLLLNDEEGQALNNFKAGLDENETTQNALDTLLTVVIPIQETNWRPRPKQDQLPGSLPGRLLIGKGRVQFWGWMTPDEVIPSRTLSQVNQAAIRRLYDQSLTRGLYNDSLQIVSRRAATDQKTENITLKSL